MELGALYAATRARIAAAAREATADELDVLTPGCPAWTVRDVLAHVTGVAVDVANGNAAGAGTDGWTARQVADRRGRSVDELLSEWEEAAPAVETFLDQFPDATRRLVIDVATHEQDMRGALRRPGGTDSGAFDFALQQYVYALDRRLRADGVAALAVRAGNQEWTIGEGEPGAALRAPNPLALFRALAGRRSVSQVRAYAWEGDPEPYLARLSPFGALPETDVEE